MGGEESPDFGGGIEGLAGRANPEIIYTHCARDLNVDHEITARAVFNVRFNDTYNPKSLETELRQRLALGGARFELKVECSGGAFVTRSPSRRPGHATRIPRNLNRLAGASMGADEHRSTRTGQQVGGSHDESDRRRRLRDRRGERVAQRRR